MQVDIKKLIAIKVWKAIFKITPGKMQYILVHVSSRISKNHLRNLFYVPQILNHLFCMALYNPEDKIRRLVSTDAVGARTRRSLGHHLLHPLILRLLELCDLLILRPRALQDAPATADPNS